MAMFLCCNKKWSWTGFVFALIMAVSRVYLMVHYTTDVIAGLIVGAIAGIIGYFIVRLIYNLVNKHKERTFCKFLLKADIINLFKKES